MDQQPKRVWCPHCASWSDYESDAVRIELRQEGVILLPDGTVQAPDANYAFLDYWHMECGTKVRLSIIAKWNDELGEYTLDPNPFVEIDVPDADPYADPHGDYEFAQESEMQWPVGRNFGYLFGAEHVAELNETFALLVDVFRSARIKAGWDS